MTAGNRCAKDIFGYCVNPDPPKGKLLNYKAQKDSFLAAGTCDLEPHLCDHYRTLTQVLPDLSVLNKKRPPQSQNKRPIPSYL